ncbi:sulfur carrier protein ThiS [Porphyromonas pogonae]|uniref:sulfur carrier protein ThiS n=1 Tax=Porphyromonas pogonae TaxID=867595 RepID=UPI002E78D8A2|nr:sulfur carrier protein ThiS [Porphyromonas pogonae]
MNIKYNDQSVEYPDGYTLGLLLQDRRIQDMHVAVAVNNKIVKRSLRDEYALHDGDEVVVIQATYGG